jgi:ArsR family transcriptional regulator, arsenate/arsenite/antimonite-responsive transcriptional repressor / arsenate reductase (thioredoxin)
MNAEQIAVAARARVHAALGDPARLAIVDTLTIGDASPGELAAALQLHSNLLAHHLKVLADAGLIRRTRSEGDRRRTYVRLVPAALAAISPPGIGPVRRVVFVCTHNSARSQFAAAIWAERSRVPGASAGTEPAERVHPRAIRVARRHGVHLDPTATAHIDHVVRPDDLVIAVCDSAHEHLPATGRSRLHWSVPDPAPADSDVAFEAAYRDLAIRIDHLVPVLTTGADHD